MRINNIPNLGRHNKEVRNTDFIRLTEKSQIVKSFNDLKKIFSTDDATTELNIKLEELTYNYLDAVTINSDGSIELKQIIDPDTGELVPEVGQNNIDNFPERFETVYTEYMDIIKDDQEWKFKLDEYFNTVFGEFIIYIQSIFSNNIYNIFTFLKYDETNDYNEIVSTQLQNNTITNSEYVRLNPDLLAYPTHGVVNIELANTEYILYGLEPIYTKMEDGSFLKNFALQMTIKDGNMFYPMIIICDNNEISVKINDFVNKSEINQKAYIHIYEVLKNIVDENGIENIVPKIYFTIQTLEGSSDIIEMDYEILLGGSPEVEEISLPVSDLKWNPDDVNIMKYISLNDYSEFGIIVSDNNIELENARYSPLNVKHLNLESKEIGEYWPQKFINFDNPRSIMDYDFTNSFKKIGNRIALKKVGNKNKFIVQKRIPNEYEYDGMTTETGKVPLGSLDILPLHNDVKTFLNNIDTDSLYTNPDIKYEIRKIEEYNNYIIIFIFSRNSYFNELKRNIVYNKSTGLFYLLNMPDGFIDSDYVEEIDGVLYYYGSNISTYEYALFSSNTSSNHNVIEMETLASNEISGVRSPSYKYTMRTLGNNTIYVRYSNMKNVFYYGSQVLSPRIYKNGTSFYIGSWYGNINIFKTRNNDIFVLNEYYRNSNKAAIELSIRGVKLIRNIDDSVPTVEDTSVKYGSWRFFLEDTETGNIFIGSIGSEGVMRVPNSNDPDDTPSNFIQTSIKYGAFDLIKTSKGIFSFNKLSIDYSTGISNRPDYRLSFKINNDVENGLGIFKYDNDLEDFVNINQNGTFTKIVETELGIFAFNELLPILYKYDEEKNIFFKYYEFSYGNMIKDVQQTISFGPIVTLNNYAGNGTDYIHSVINNFSHKILSLNDLDTYFVKENRIQEYTNTYPEKIVYTIHPNYIEQDLFREENCSDLTIGQMVENDNGDVIFNNEYMSPDMITNGYMMDFFYRDSRLGRYILGLNRSFSTTQETNEMYSNIYVRDNDTIEFFRNSGNFINFKLSDPKNPVFHNRNVTNGKIISTSKGSFGLQNIRKLAGDIVPNKFIFKYNGYGDYDIVYTDEPLLYPTSLIEFDDTIYVGDDQKNIYIVNTDTNSLDMIMSDEPDSGYYLFNTDTLGPIIFSRYSNTNYKYFDKDGTIITVDNVGDDSMYNLGVYRNWAFDRDDNLKQQTSFTKLAINDFVFDYGKYGVYALVIKSPLKEELAIDTDTSVFSLVRLSKTSDGKIISEKCNLGGYPNEFYLGKNISNLSLYEGTNFTSNVSSFGFHLMNYGLVFNLNGLMFILNTDTLTWKQINGNFRNRMIQNFDTNEKFSVQSPVLISSDKNLSTYLDESEYDTDDFIFDSLYFTNTDYNGLQTGYTNNITYIGNKYNSSIVTIIPSIYEFDKQLDDPIDRLKIEQYLDRELKMYVLLENNFDIKDCLLYNEDDENNSNPTGKIGTVKIDDTRYNFIYDFKYKISVDGHMYIKTSSMEYVVGSGFVNSEDTKIEVIKYYKCLVSEFETNTDITVLTSDETEYDSILDSNNDSWYDTSIFDNKTGFKPLLKVMGAVGTSVESLLCYNISTNTLQYMTKIDWKIQKELDFYDKTKDLSISTSENEIYGLGDYYTEDEAPGTQYRYYHGISRYKNGEFKKCSGTDNYSKFNNTWYNTPVTKSNTFIDFTLSKEYGLIANGIFSSNESILTLTSDFDYPFLYRDKYDKDSFKKFDRLYKSDNFTSLLNKETDNGLFSVGNKMGIFKKGNIVRFDEIHLLPNDKTIITSSVGGFISNTSIGMYVNVANIEDPLLPRKNIKYNKYLGEFQEDTYYSSENDECYTRIIETSEGIFTMFNGLKYGLYDGYYLNDNILLTESNILPDDQIGTQNYRYVNKSEVIETDIGVLIYYKTTDPLETNLFRYDLPTRNIIPNESLITGNTGNRFSIVKYKDDIMISNGGNRIYKWDGIEFKDAEIVLTYPDDMITVSNFLLFNSSNNDLFFYGAHEYDSKYRNMFKYNEQNNTFELIPSDVICSDYNETTDLKEFEHYSFNEIIKEFQDMKIPTNTFIKTFGHIVYNGAIIKISSIKINENDNGVSGITFNTDPSTRIPLGGETYINLIDFTDDSFTLGTISRGNKEGYNNAPDFKTNISKIELSIIYDYKDDSDNFYFYEGLLFNNGSVYTGDYDRHLYEYGVFQNIDTISFYDNMIYLEGVRPYGFYENSNIIYYDGFLYTGIYNNKLYIDGEIVKGLYSNNGLLYNDGVFYANSGYRLSEFPEIKLFYNGFITTGYHAPINTEGSDIKTGGDILYYNGIRISEGFYQLDSYNYLLGNKYSGDRTISNIIESQLYQIPIFPGISNFILDIFTQGGGGGGGGGGGRHSTAASNVTADGGSGGNPDGDGYNYGRTNGTTSTAGRGGNGGNGDSILIIYDRIEKTGIRVLGGSAGSGGSGAKSLASKGTSGTPGGTGSSIIRSISINSIQDRTLQIFIYGKENDDFNNISGIKEGIGGSGGGGGSGGAAGKFVIGSGANGGPGGRGKDGLGVTTLKILLPEPTIVT